MNKGNHTPLETVKEFCLAWFTERDLERAAQYCSEDVTFMGTGENERACGKTALQEYLRQDIAESQLPFSVRFCQEDEYPLSPDAAIVALELDLICTDYILHLHASYTLTRAQTHWLLRHMHFTIPASQQGEGEHYPLTLVRKKINKARYELLSSSVAGGLMGGYVEDKFPFYYVNDRMLKHLGYGSESEFVNDIDGYIINCMHPDDRQAVDESVMAQLANGDEYTVEYRMRRKDGEYIYVHDTGRVIVAEDGRPAIMSVCIDISDQLSERQHNDELIKELDASTLIGTLNDGICEPTYVSSGLGGMMGYSRDEMLQIISRGLSSIIHPMDQDAFLSDQQRMLHTSDKVDGTYRILHKQGHYIWIRVIYRHIGETAGRPLVRYIFASLSKQFDSRNNLLTGIDIGIFAINPVNYELCYANPIGFKMMDKQAGDYYGHKCYEFLAGRTSPCEYCVLQKPTDQPIEMYVPRVAKTFNAIVKDADWMGRSVRIKYLTDITAQKNIQENLKLSEQRLAAAIRHAELQFWEYDVRHDRAYISEFTQQCYGLPPIMENFPQSIVELGIIHPDDVAAYLHLHEQLKTGVPEIMLEYRAARPNLEYRWLMVHYTVSFDEDGTPMRAFASAESIDRFKDLEEGFLIAAKLTGVRIWTINMQQRTICLDAPGGTDAKRFLPCATEADFAALDIVIPADVHESWSQFMLMFNGADDVTFKARFKHGNKYRWHRVTHTVLRANNGMAIKAIGVSTDIHEHMLLEQRFGQEMEYSSQLQASNLITKVRCNITNGTVDLYSGTKNTAVTLAGASYDESAEKLALTAVEPKKQAELRHYLNRERVIRAYAQGENSYDLVYLRRGLDQTTFWAHTTVKSYQDPATGDIMSFMYTFNIDEQKTAEAIVNRVVDTNFEYLTLFSIVTGRVERTIDKAGVMVKPEAGALYEVTVAEGLAYLFAKDDLQANLHLFKVQNIVDHLNQNGTYSLSFDILESGSNEMRHKLWVFNWYDELHSKVLCSRSDITEVHRQEHQQKEALTAALTAAKQANAAKSTFLSRMSHEIRTPMNAIIGMTTIAAKSIGNDERIVDCLSKIEVSSRFLLALINDILDMSRIESGKMLLKSDEIPFDDFLNDIGAICNPQAAAKGITCECIAEPSLDPYYIGDARKLQQVLVNILGNAIKFTGSGGRVMFSISQPRRTQTDATLRFVISDTGIGIDKDFLPRLFESFEQENVGTSAEFGGTGLGLAISKSIVSMMDGNIRVNSVKGVGTEFTVDVKLGLTSKSPVSWESAASHQFSQLNALVVDDDVIVGESTLLTLNEIGMEAEFVDSGIHAVQRVSEMWAWHKHYDIILIDWKMPEMNGIEACRRIREIVGPEATIIIITAYDWYAIEQEAKQAGVNLLINKPLFKSTLISAFMKVLDGKYGGEKCALREKFDFTGKRLLVVEDNAINAEIAEVLLKDVGFSVDLAENGVAAVELFSRAAVGHYDAILMDIRMPVMDGLQASAKIRELARGDARSVPIIAMTADAFDEDAEKCRAAGMNQHLAKPIDPPMLYRTLHDFIF